MRKGLLASLFGFVAVYAVACGEEEEPRDIEIPSEIFTNGTAAALRTTGFGVTPNSSHVRRALARMITDEGTFTDLVTRGGLPTEGAVTPDIGGSAPQQIAAFAENGGLFAEGDAVDDCGNPQLAAFVTPAMVQAAFDATEAEVLGQSIWPGVCEGDIACDTSVEGQWEVGFSELRGDGNMDLIVSLSPVAGQTTQPAYQGHLLAYLLSANHPGLLSAPLFANIRSFTLSAFGMVRYAKGGISMRPNTMFMPTEIYAFPPEPRELGAADMIVAFEAFDQCADSWRDTFGGQVPFGCDQMKPLVLDRTAPAGESIYENHTEEGTDPSRLDQLISAFEYQLKTAIACPDISEPRWIREDLPGGGGSVELFQCPDGDLDLCLAFHDMEDAYCERNAPPSLYGEPDPEIEVVAELPVIEGTRTEVSDAISGVDNTFKYAVNGDEYTLDWPWTRSGTTPTWELDNVVGKLNDQEQARADGGPVLVTFHEGDNGVLVKPAAPLGPTGSLAMGDGSVNSTLGLADGLSSENHAPRLTLGEVAHLLTAVALDGDGDLVSYPFETAYARINTDGFTHLYTDAPGRVLALFDNNGNELHLPGPVVNTHCENQGAARIDLSDLPSGAHYIEVDLTVDGSDELYLLATSVQDWVQ